MSEVTKESRSTSATNRLPVKSRPRSTAPQPTAAGSDVSPTRGRHTAGMTDKSSQATMGDNIRGFDRRSGIRSAAYASDVIDPVMQDRIWTQTLLDERRRNKIW